MNGVKIQISDVVLIMLVLLHSADATVVLIPTWQTLMHWIYYIYTCGPQLDIFSYGWNAKSPLGWGDEVWIATMERWLYAACIFNLVPLPWQLEYMRRQQTGAAFALPYICNIVMAMLFNSMFNTGQDTTSDCSVRPLILLCIHLEHIVSHMAYRTDSTNRKKVSPHQHIVLGAQGWGWPQEGQQRQFPSL